MRILILRFEAPLMSFGGVVVDQFNGTDRYPYRSMLTGLLANALGWERADEEQHQSLQQRLRYAARLDLPGQILRDYQTVDFGPDGPSASKLAWTTRGKLEERKGQSGDGTHIRFRDYLADSVTTVAMTLLGDESPSLDEAKQALRMPARPLFLGRKCCLPSTPILLDEVEAPNLAVALTDFPLAKRTGSHDEQVSGVMMISEASSNLEMNHNRQTEVYRTEDKDWANSIHVGRRRYVEELVFPKEKQS